MTERRKDNRRSMSEMRGADEIMGKITGSPGRQRILGILEGIRRAMKQRGQGSTDINSTVRETRMTASITEAPHADHSPSQDEGNDQDTGDDWNKHTNPPRELAQWHGATPPRPYQLYWDD